MTPERKSGANRRPAKRKPSAKRRPAQKPADKSDFLTASVKGKERTALLELGTALERERPVPSPGFRSEMRSALLRRGTRRQAPGRIRALVFAYGMAGLLLLAVAGIGVAGAGPLAAG